MLNKQKIISDFLIVFIAGSSLFFSCNSSKTSTNKEDKGAPNKVGFETKNSYFPIGSNNKWQYINEGPRDESVLFDVKMEKMDYKGAELEADLNSFPFFTGNPDIVKLVFKDNGQIYSINKDGKEELFLESQDKLTQSNKWQYGQWEAYVGSTGMEVKAEKETFKNCIYISYSQYFTFAAELWLAKDVGIVKWGYNRTNPPTFKPQYYVLNNLTLEK